MKNPNRSEARRDSRANGAIREPDSDTRRLASQAYRRLDWSRDILKRCKALQKHDPSAFRSIEALHNWFLAPVSLWPFNLQELLALVLDDVDRGRSVAPDVELLLSVLPPVPSQKTQQTVTEHEHDVQAGRYEHLVKVSGAKFLAEERELAKSRELRADWRRIKAAFPVKEFADHKGVVRRTMTPERNLSRDFTLDWKHSERRFQAVFNAYCLKWNLYGMENDRPLLLKLSVNLTAYGTMIFIPAYWSLDFKRDLNFGAVSGLHRARVPHRQGPAISENKRHRRKQAAILRELDAAAKARGLRGEKKHLFLCAGLKLNQGTDAKYFARLRKEFPQ